MSVLSERVRKLHLQKDLEHRNARRIAYFHKLGSPIPSKVLRVLVVFQWQYMVTIRTALALSVAHIVGT